MRNHFHRIRSANRVRNTFALHFGTRFLAACLGLALSCVVITSTPSPSSAAMLRKLPFSASLKNAAGTTVADGNYTIVFSIYTALTGGTAVWQETQTIAVVNGVISANLGDVTAIPSSLTFNDTTYYLGVKVGTDAEASPRRTIGAVPLALNSSSVGGYYPGSAANEVLLLDSSGRINITGNVVTSGTLQAATATVATLNTSSGNLTVTPAGGTTAITGILTVSSTSSFSDTLTVSKTGGNALALTGAPAASTTSSLFRLGSAISGGSANGTFIGVNAASGFSGNFIDFQVANDTKFKVTSSGITVGGSILPTTTGTADLGSASLHFANAYIDNIVAGSTSTSGTTSTSFTINQNAVGDADSSLVFYRGGALTSASLLWKSGTGTNGIAVNSGAFTLNNPQWIISTTPADADYGHLSIGTNAASFDGTTSGYFAGSASGTELAINSTSGFGGNLIDAQVAGVSKLSVTAAGVLTTASTINGATISGGTLSGGSVSGGSLSASAVNGLSVASGVISGQLAVSTNGAVSTPAEILTGTWYTGGTSTTTKPQLLIEPTGTTSNAWSTSGTGIGANAASGFAGNLIDLQVAASSKFSVSSAGAITAASTVNGATLSGGTLTGGSLSATAVNGLSVASGTISVGTWNGTAIGAQYGGTGLNSSSSTGVATVSSGTWSIASSLGATLGGTGQTTVTTGDLLYGSGSNTWGKLAGVATGSILISGGVGVAPSWSAAPTLTTSLTVPLITTASGALTLQAANGTTKLLVSGTSSTLEIYGSGGTNKLSLTHNNTNGVISTSSGELQLQGSGTNQLIIGDVGTAVNLVFEESSTISGQGANTITLGQSGDTFNLNTTGVTYNIASLASTGATLTTSSTSTTALTINGPTSLSANLLDLQVNGSSKLSVSATGAITAVGVTTSAAITNSTSGANALAFTGSPAASATSSLIQMGSAIASGSANGTYIGINPSSFSGNFADFQVNGTSYFKVTSAGAITASSTINGLTITNNGTNTLNIAAGKSLVVSNSLTLAGTDSTTITFPGSSATVATLGLAQTFTAAQTITPTANSAVALTVNGTSGLTPGNALTIAQGTITTTAAQALGITGTWNDSGTTHTLIKADLTDTASAAASLLFDLQVASTSKLSVTKAGALTTASTVNGATLSGGTLSGGSLSATAVNGLSVASGTVSVGTWNGTAITSTYGGTGLNSSSSTGVATVSTGTWSISSSLGATLGGTGQTTVTTGDLLYGSGSNTWGKLADVATGSVLISGGVGVAPSWSNSPTVTSLTTATLTSASTLALTSASNGHITVTPNGTGDVKIVTSGNAGSYLYIGDGGTTNYAQFDTNGALSFAGAARPYSEIILTADDAIFPGAAACATGSNAGTNHQYRTVDCGDAGGNTDEAAFWQFKMPQNYVNSSNVQVDIYWITADTSGKVDWEPGYIAAAAGSATNFDTSSRTDLTGQTGSSVNGTANAVKASTYTLTSPTISADDLVSFRLNRDASDTTEDTAASDARVLNVRLKFMVGS